MKRRALLSVIGMTTLAGCSRLLGNDTPSEPTPSPGPNPTDSQTASVTATTSVSNESPLKLIRHDLIRSNEGSTSELAAVTGTVHNPTDRTIPEATITARFKDANGAVLDQTSVSASDLSPAQSWSFELVYPGTGEDARTVTDYALTVEINT